MAMPTLNLANIGAGIAPEQVANDPAKLFPPEDINIETVDVDRKKEPTHIYDITKPIPNKLKNKYDIVFCSHVLEHINANKVFTAMENMDKMLKVGGEMYIFVPSMDWYASQIMGGRESPVLNALVFGGQNDEYDVHRSGFTLNTLRHLVEFGLGYMIRRAYSSPFHISHVIADREPLVYKVMQNVIIGYKLEERKKPLPEPKTVVSDDQL